MTDAAEHLGLVGWVMKRFRVRERFQPVDADDVEGELGVAIVRAAQLHDPARGRFSTYAVKFLTPLAVVGTNSNRHRLRMRVRRLAWRDRRWVVRVSFFSELGRRFAHDSFLLATQPSAADVAEAAEGDPPLSAAVADALRHLKPRDAAVVRMRVGLGRFLPHTLEEVSRKLGVTRERVRQLEAMAYLKLRKHLEADPRAADWRD